MKKLTNWFNNHKEGILKSFYSLPIIFAIGISIFHCIEWFAISNPPLFAIALSIGIEVAAATTLVALLFGKMTFSIVMTFILVTLYQMIGNIFFSFHHIDENGELFKTWVAFMSIILGEGNEWTEVTHKFWLSIMSGAIVPLLSLLSLHLISTFELRNKKDGNKIEEDKPEEKIEEVKPKIEVVVEKKPELKIEEEKPKEKEVEVIETKEEIEEPVIVKKKRGRKIKDPKVVLGNPNIDVEKSTDINISRKPAIIIPTKNPTSQPAIYNDMGKPKEQVEKEKKDASDTRRIRLPGVAYDKLTS